MWGKREDMVVHEEEPFNAEPPRAALAGRPLTEVAAFYSRNHGPVPRLDPSSWRLRVDGLVDRELELSLDELRSRFRPRTEVATLACAGNRRAGLAAVRPVPGAPWGPAAISTAEWTGVRLADVLRAAGPRTGAAHIAFLGADESPCTQPPQPFGGSVPLSKARGGEVLLAWSMNGEPLPAVHGGPVRVVVPGYIGARSVKWVRRLTARAEPSQNHFQAVDYRLLPPDADAHRPGQGVPLGPLALNAEILSPDDGAQLAAGPTTVTGWAFAGGGERTVVRVDVSLDEGRSWVQADVDAPVGPWAWQHWRTLVSLPAGPAEIAVRAWDDTGATQPESPAHLWNPKGYANNSWARVRIDVR
ncbi:sulfite oxidase [Streptomyces sp. Ru73]|uniref:sulfite oxidase n=1 Tax=Streptomyces sp. Ru73 TaxID=2080748 RepID=UPI000CDE49F9|nr:sulfite oxidase [Streptomyces sp. Ru73]POX42743.1 sulfite oxidase [Streptomyces sp. Ru73]